MKKTSFDGHRHKIPTLRLDYILRAGMMILVAFELVWALFFYQQPEIPKNTYEMTPLFGETFVVEYHICYTVDSQFRKPVNVGGILVRCQNTDDNKQPAEFIVSRFTPLK